MANLLRVSVAVVATLLLGEMLFRACRAREDLVPPHPDLSVSAEWDWARTHLRMGHPTLPGEAHFDPRVGWVAAPWVRRAEGEETWLRPPRQPGVPRIVLTGDSFMRELATLGSSFLPDWELVNVAVPGYGAGQTWLRYRTEGARWSGDIVVFGLYLRDYFRTFRSFRSYAKPVVVLDDAGELRVTGVPVISPEALYEAYRSGERKVGGHGLRSFVWDFLGERRAIWRKHALRDEDLRVLAAILAQFQRDVRAAGGCPFLLIFPTRPDRYEGVYRELDLRTRETARVTGLPHLALAEAFYEGRDRAEHDRLFEREGGHLSTLGKRESIEALHERLAGHPPGSCPP